MTQVHAYYNDSDPFCAQWLRNLIAAGAIPAGCVDERSIADVEPSDLAGYRHVHFFAGIGGWAYALQLAGWDRDRPVWTGSCPCQPFSSAGRQGGALDERHLWPRWLRLIRECRPHTILGEQVEGAVGFGWVDRVFADLEAEGYACGAAVLGAHSVGAPHIRQRLFWVAQSSGAECGAWRPRGVGAAGGWAYAESTGSSNAGGMADASGQRRQQVGRGALGDEGADGRQPDGDHLASGNVATGWLGDTARREMGRARQPWQDSVWLPCLDGKARRTQRGILPLASGLPLAVDGLGPISRVGALRGSGNAICPHTAALFIEAVIEAMPG